MPPDPLNTTHHNLTKSCGETLSNATHCLFYMLPYKPPGCDDGPIIQLWWGSCKDLGVILASTGSIIHVDQWFRCHTELTGTR